MKVNKTIKGQPTRRTDRFKIRVQTNNEQLQQLNHHCFQIQLPEYHKTHRELTNRSAFTYPSNACQSQETAKLDERKQQIKQKIKFRVKQDLWNLLKKQNYRSQAQQVQYQQTLNQWRSAKRPQSDAYIIGRSFTRFSRKGQSSSRNRYNEETNKTEQSVPKDFSEKKGNCIKQFKQRRIWSSMGKTRDKDRTLADKYKLQINTKMVQMESYDIQPWQAVEDPEHQFNE